MNKIEVGKIYDTATGRRRCIYVEDDIAWMIFGADSCAWRWTVNGAAIDLGSIHDVIWSEEPPKMITRTITPTRKDKTMTMEYDHNSNGTLLEEIQLLLADKREYTACAREHLDAVIEGLFGANPVAHVGNVVATPHPTDGILPAIHYGILQDLNALSSLHDDLAYLRRRLLPAERATGG